jgi:hypothetical protein
VACKRSLNATWKSGIQAKFIGHFSPTLVSPLAARISRRRLVVPPLAARISRRQLVVKVGTSKNKGLYIYIVPPLAARISETTSGESWNV